MSETAARQTGRFGLVLAALIFVLIVLHLFGDRLTPASDEARVHAYVVPIAAEVGGTVTAVHVANNQRVAKGQPLFTLGSDNYDIAVEKARADVAATVREQEAQDAAVTAARASQQVALAELERAARDSGRLERINAEDKGAVSVRRLDVARASLKEAQARVVAAGAQVDQALAARGPTNADNDRLVAARSALKRAELDRRRTTVLAPGDGVVTDLKTEVGQFAGAGSPIMTFISTKDAWITANMTENNLGRMKLGDPAEIVLDVLPGTVITGRVRSIGSGVSAGSKTQPGSLPEIQNSRDFLRQAQRFPVVIAFDRPDETTIKALREGGQADVIVYTGDHAVMNALGRLYIRVKGLLSYAY
jgi:multidrug resistance efflux pump